MNERRSDWRAQLKEAARSLEDLVRLGVLTSDETQGMNRVYDRYKTLVTPYYLSLIDQNDPHCPIRKQAIPTLLELDHIQGELRDPIGDKRHAPTSLLVHRYPDRALLFLTYQCPMFCRYCFRKDTLNDEQVRLRRELPQSLEYLRAHPEIEEVILSGGDPLMLSNQRLSEVLYALCDVGIQRIRVHSRFPVTLPQRIDHDLVALLSQVTPITLVTHFNHSKELTEESSHALQLLRRAGVMLLNQSVLLAGVNDSVESLKDLSRGLIRQGVRPYYLHHPDLTAGTQHFRVSLKRGLSLMASLRGALSGFALPTYVIDIPKGGGKVPVDSHYVQMLDQEFRWSLTSPITGEKHLYYDLADQEMNTLGEVDL